MYSLDTIIQPSVPPRELSRVPSTVTAKGDSAASNHFMTEQDEHILKDVQPIQPLSITLPDSTNIDGTRKGNLPIPHLSKSGSDATVVPRLTNSSLISLGQLCDDGCIVRLDKKHLLATKNKKYVLHGTRNPHDRLWDIHLPTHSTPTTTLQPLTNVSVTAKHAGLYHSPTLLKKTLPVSPNDQHHCNLSSSSPTCLT